MHGQCVRNIDSLLVKERTLLRLLRGDLKLVTESEIIVAQDYALLTKRHATKYYRQKRIANVDCVNNLTRHETTLRHDQY